MNMGGTDKRPEEWYGIRLSTGRFFEIGGAGCAVLGIGSDLEISEGFDSDRNEQWVGKEWLDVDPDKLTNAEKMEVCDAMIDRWSRLKAQLASGG